MSAGQAEGLVLPIPGIEFEAVADVLIRPLHTIDLHGRAILRLTLCRDRTEHLHSEITRLRSLVESLAGPSSDQAAPTKRLRMPSPPHAPEAPLDSHGLDWTSHAAWEISQLTHRRIDPGGLGSASIYQLEPRSDPDPAASSNLDMIPAWPSRLHDYEFRRRAFQYFADRINRFECLIDGEYLSGLSCSLDQPYHSLLLLVAIISASTVVTRERRIGDELVQCAERMVTRACTTPTATLVAARALTILVWRELTVGGNPTRTWMFNCMAAALLQQLGVFDWSLETIEKEQQNSNFSEKLTAFWAFSAVDRICAALLGRMSSIPWRHNIQIPRFSTTFVPAAPVTVEKLYFDHIWALWRLHGYYMNILYTPRFATMPESQRQTLRLDCKQAIANLRSLVDPRVKLGSDRVSHHPFLYFLQMAFDTSPITLNLPYLGCGGSEQDECLQEMIEAATSHTDLLSQFRKFHKLTDSPPVIIYFTVRAATIHLLLATSTDATVQRFSWHRLKICLESLQDIQSMWYFQASRAIRYVQGLAARWGVTHALLSSPGPSLDFDGASGLGGGVGASTEGYDSILWQDLPPADLGISNAELESMQWVISQDSWQLGPDNPPSLSFD
ncbi:unnamed protein product [Clonostachys rosea]|uniref:Transcription factor domain-containing protein n=1 Tax=Bionectria ochroleuca TaxID=29856 RepID=A0ABY6U4V7_BIOOC|nr:unnamed protein product [Clonostachys rosea]